MSDVLLDSVIFIDHFNGVLAATGYLKQIGDRGSISAITRAEVLSGLDANGRAKAKAVLDRYPLHPVDASVADLAAELRREHRWHLPDAIQAAVAQLRGLRLATRDTDGFPPKKHAFVVVPYRLDR